jgi:hypothetical protein
MRLVKFLTAFRIALGLTILNTAGFSAAGEVDAACHERLKSEGPPHWADAAKLAEDLDVKCEESAITRTRDQNGKLETITKEWVWNLSWDRANSRRMIDLETIGKGVQSRRTLNPKYRFHVAQIGGKDRPWQYDFGRKADVPGEFAKLDLAEETTLLAVQSSYRIVGVPLDTILNDRIFRLTTVRYLRTVDKAERHVWLEADYFGAGGEFLQPGESYWAELDPGKSWLIVQGGTTRQNSKQEQRQVVTYQSTGAAVPFPATFVWSITDPASETSVTKTYRFQSPTKCSRPESEFYLANYNIPESVLETPATRPSTLRLLMYFAVWVGALGLILFVVKLWRKPKPKE